MTESELRNDIAEFPSIYVGDVYGIYETGWSYLEFPNAILIIGEKDATFESTVKALTHEFLHVVLTRILAETESRKANYGLDYLIFVEERLSEDLS